MPITNVGQMNDRIGFYQIKTVKDESGTPRKQEVLLFSCWAAIRTQYLKEVTATIGTKLENTLTFIIRYQQRHEVTNDMTVKHKGIKYNIVQINPDLQNKQFTTVIARVAS